MTVFFFSTGNLKVVMPIRYLEDAGNCFILKYIYIPIACVFSCTSLIFIQAKFSFSAEGIKKYSSISDASFFYPFPYCCKIMTVFLMLIVSSRKCPVFG